MKGKFLLLIFLFLILGNLALLVFYRYLRFQKDKTVADFLCPVPKEYCKKGKALKEGDYYFGVGYSVPEGTPIKAIIDGIPDARRVSYNQKLGGGIYPMILLENKEDNLKVFYILTGADYQRVDKITKGTNLEKTREGEIAKFGVNLIVKVEKINNGKTEILELKSSDFK